MLFISGYFLCFPGVEGSSSHGILFERSTAATSCNFIVILIVESCFIPTREGCCVFCADDEKREVINQPIIVNQSIQLCPVVPCSPSRHISLTVCLIARLSVCHVRVPIGSWCCVYFFCTRYALAYIRQRWLRPDPRTSLTTCAVPSWGFSGKLLTVLLYSAKCYLGYNSRPSILVAPTSVFSSVTARACLL